MLKSLVFGLFVASFFIAQATQAADNQPAIPTPQPAPVVGQAEKLSQVMAARYLRANSRGNLSPAGNAEAFSKGRVLGSAGLRFNSGTPVLTAQLEKGITDDISAGGRITFLSRYGVTAFSVGAVGNYHFGNLLKVNNPALDPYAGLYLAIPVATGYGETYSGGVFGHLLLGTRYFFNDRFGLMGQLNLGLINSSGTSLELGVSYAFK